MIARFVLLSMLCVLSTLQARLIPDDDPTAHKMRAERRRPLLHHDGRYFTASIPKQIHQIWFREGAPPAQAGSWLQYAQRYDYEYRLWTTEDDVELTQLMLPETFKLMIDCRAAGDIASAEHIVSYELLRVFGGVYADTRLSAPSVDLAAMTPMRGCVFTTEKEGRAIFTCAILVTPRLMMSCAGHPLFEHLVYSIESNYAACWQNGIRDPKVLTGTYLLNRVLGGTFSLLPPHYLKQFGTDVLQD